MKEQQSSSFMWSSSTLTSPPSSSSFLEQLQMKKEKFTDLAAAEKEMKDAKERIVEQDEDCEKAVKDVLEAKLKALRLAAELYSKAQELLVRLSGGGGDAQSYFSKLDAEDAAKKLGVVAGADVLEVRLQRILGAADTVLNHLQGSGGGANGRRSAGAENMAGAVENTAADGGAEESGAGGADLAGELDAFLASEPKVEDIIKDAFDNGGETAKQYLLRLDLSAS
ncbi:unnamed protein product [Amoebophrya sp. A25]|nr:unnamed protein product [Amoebophrya sp. A25]|eukprot:GSA25T00006514001.1